MKVVVLYQVIFAYRVSVYERLASAEGLDVSVWHCADMKGTKKKNYTGEKTFKTSKLKSFFLKFSTNNSANVMPISWNLLFKLIVTSPDVILSEGTSSLFNASIAFIYSKIFRKRFIWWSLGELAKREHKGIRKLMNDWIVFIETHADAVFTYSSQGEAYFKNVGVASDKIHKAINVIDTDKKLRDIEQTHKEVTIEQSSFFNIVFVGAIIKEKQLELLVDAFQSLNQKYESKFKLHIIGDGLYANEIKEYAKGIEFIEFYGHVSDGLSKYLLSSDVLVLPGLGGLAICDGMIHGLPIITGRADGTEIDLVDESCGFFIDEMTSERLYESIEYLYLNPEKKKEMGKSSFERITTKFTMAKYMDTLLTCIKG